jgi:hypothetical protein
VNADPQPPACPACGALATDHGGILQCTANPGHIDVYDLAAVKFPVTLKRKPASLEPRTRPDGLTPGERMAIGWARKHRARWGDKGRNLADGMRQQFPWLDDDELARIALYFGKSIEHTHRHGSWPGLDVISWTQILQAAAMELAYPELDDPGQD